MASLLSSAWPVRKSMGGRLGGLPSATVEGDLEWPAGVCVCVCVCVKAGSRENKLTQFKHGH